MNDAMVSVELDFVVKHRVSMGSSLNSSGIFTLPLGSNILDRIKSGIFTLPPDMFSYWSRGFFFFFLFFSRRSVRAKALGSLRITGSARATSTDRGGDILVGGANSGLEAVDSDSVRTVTKVDGEVFRSPADNPERAVVRRL